MRHRQDQRDSQGSVTGSASTGCCPLYNHQASCSSHTPPPPTPRTHDCCPQQQQSDWRDLLPAPGSQHPTVTSRVGTLILPVSPHCPRHQTLLCSPLQPQGSIFTALCLANLQPRHLTFKPKLRPKDWLCMPAFSPPLCRTVAGRRGSGCWSPLYHDHTHMPSYCHHAAKHSSHLLLLLTSCPVLEERTYPLHRSEDPGRTVTVSRAECWDVHSLPRSVQPGLGVCNHLRATGQC